MRELVPNDGRVVVDDADDDEYGCVVLRPRGIVDDANIGEAVVARDFDDEFNDGDGKGLVRTAFADLNASP